MTASLDDTSTTEAARPEAIDFLGIDLSAQPGNTAVCAIHEHGGKLVARSVSKAPGGWTDEALLDEMRRARWIGIDAPFGWPVAFAEAIAGSAEGGEWIHAKPPATKKYDYSQLRLRFTDQFVAKRAKDSGGRPCNPLSVSSDSIGVVGFRAASLLSTFAAKDDWVFDRTGVNEQNSRRVLEVYPAATLALLGIRLRGQESYKTNSGRQLRETYFEPLCLAAGIEQLSEERRSGLLATDHEFDAFVSAATAVLAFRRETVPPTGAASDQIAREGWIHVPKGPAKPGLSSLAV